MKFGLGSEMEQWLHDRHLFYSTALLVVLLSVLFVAGAYFATAPTPTCGIDSYGHETCKLFVEHD